MLGQKEDSTDTMLYVAYQVIARVSIETQRTFCHMITTFYTLYTAEYRCQQGGIMTYDEDHRAGY